MIREITLASRYERREAMTVSLVHPDLKALVSRRLDELSFGGRRMSYRQAARKATDKGYPISPETVRQIDVGTHSGRISDGTVDALAAALDVSRADILRAMHEQRSQPLSEWVPPEAANRMTLKQRRVVETLIGILVDREESVDRPTDEQSSPDAATPIMSRSVTTDQVTAENDEPIVQADVGQLAEQTAEEREYVDMISDAALNRLRRRLLGE